MGGLLLLSHPPSLPLCYPWPQCLHFLLPLSPPCSLGPLHHCLSIFVYLLGQHVPPLHPGVPLQFVPICCYIFFSSPLLLCLGTYHPLYPLLMVSPPVLEVIPCQVTGLPPLPLPAAVFLYIRVVFCAIFRGWAYLVSSQ